MNRYQLLFATPDVSVSRFDHPPHEAHDDPDEEVATRWAIAFVQSGSFDVVQGRRCVRLQRGSVFLSRPGFIFSCSHHEECPSDVCLSIGFEPRNVVGSEHAWARAGWAVRRSPTPRLAYVDQRIRDAAAGGDTFQLERWALAALTALEADADEGMTRGRYAARGTALDAVVATCRTIETGPCGASQHRRSCARRGTEQCSAHASVSPLRGNGATCIRHAMPAGSGCRAARFRHECQRNVLPVRIRESESLLSRISAYARRSCVDVAYRRS